MRHSRGSQLSDLKRYWIGFNLVKGIGSARLRALLDTFGDVETAWRAREEDLRAAGLSARIIENLVQLRADLDLELVWQRVQAQTSRVLTWEDPDYPRRLMEIDQPPPVLYTLGELLDVDEWAIAVVGSRRITSYGRQVTEEIAASLARNGITVVSGLARGVDAVAHQAALRAGGRTLAVLGSGVDRIYPPEHRQLAEQIITQGAILSDYPLGTPPDATNFPPRNRIIAGLARATVVVEAGERSGALITAAFAAEQGREVFAVPGSIFAQQSKGPNRLILDGARPLLDVKDLLEVLDMVSIGDFRQARTVLPADAVEAQLYSILGREPMHVDEIRSRANLPIEKVSAALTLMELKGMIRQVGGMHYVALRETGPEYQTGE
jgi:DNA processing protein